MKMFGGGQSHADRVRLREQQEGAGPSFVNPSGALLAAFTLVKCYQRHPWTWTHGLWLCGIALAVWYVWQAFWSGILARSARGKAGRRQRR